MSTFVQFRYCPLCRLNHRKGKKHVLSKRHQEIVQNVLKKFSKRIAEAKATLQAPSVKDLGWAEADKMFWCYFCQQELSRHRRNVSVQGDCVMEHGGILEHITRPDHVDNTTKFLKENKVNLTRTSEFVLTSELFLKYLEEVENVSSQMFRQKADSIKKVACQLRNQEAVRHQILREGLIQQNLLQQVKQQAKIPPVKEDNARSKLMKTSGDEERGKKTIQAFGEGLTVIDRTNEDDTLGNIYSNALPPWLQPANEGNDMSGVIGPTMEDLEKHNKLEKKKQLPAGRVGAKFDHKTNQAESWLPNFGGVWKHGRRTNSGQQFNKRYREKLKPYVKKSTSLSETSQSPVSQRAEPFFNPNIPRRTSTVTSGMDSRVNGHSVLTMDPKIQDQFSPPSKDFSLPDRDSFNDLARQSAISLSSHSSITKKYPLPHHSSLTNPVNLNLTPDAEEITNSLIVRPYISKRRAKAMMETSSTLSSDVAQHSATSHIMQVNAGPSQMQNPEARSTFNNNTNSYHQSSSFSSNTETLRHPGHLTSQHLGGSSGPANLVPGHKTGQPFRLLATPVLNKGKKRNILPTQK